MKTHYLRTRSTQLFSQKGSGPRYRNFRNVRSYSVSSSKSKVQVSVEEMEISGASVLPATENTEVGTCAVCMTDVWEGAKLPCYHKLCVDCCNALFVSAEAELRDQVSSDSASNRPSQV